MTKVQTRSLLLPPGSDFIIKSDPLVAISTQFFLHLDQIDPSQKISAGAVEVLGTGAAKAQCQFPRGCLNQADADSQGMIDPLKIFLGQLANVLTQACFINGPDLAPA